MKKNTKNATTKTTKTATPKTTGKPSQKVKETKTTKTPNNPAKPVKTQTRKSGKVETPVVETPKSQNPNGTRPQVDCAKVRVYKLWSKSPDKTKKIAESLAQKEGVQLTTVKGWISSWSHGNNIPSACVATS